MKKELRFQITPELGKTSGILDKPDNAQSLLILAHGAGTDMRHPFMENLCAGLAILNIASFRYNFPYKEKGKGGPNSPKILMRTVAAANKYCSERFSELSIFAGGKSMGGRMTSMAASEELLPTINGIIFYGFPLHAAGKPGTERAEHLKQVRVPMLFLQGPRDTLAKPELISPMVQDLGSRATMHMVEGAERTQEDVLNELVEVTSKWLTRLI